MPKVASAFESESGGRRKRPDEREREDPWAECSSPSWQRRLQPARLALADGWSWWVELPGRDTWKKRDGRQGTYQQRQSLVQALQGSLFARRCLWGGKPIAIMAWPISWGSFIERMDSPFNGGKPRLIEDVYTTPAIGLRSRYSRNSRAS